MDDLDRGVLEEPFSEEVEMAIVGMKTKSALGPNGFTVSFFNKLWKHIKKEIQ
jgi:hypothetical protein